MNITQIDNNLQNLVKTYNQASFIYDLLLAFGFPKASIKRLQSGGLNLSKVNGEITWKKKLFFKEVESEELYTVIDAVKSSNTATKHDPRFIIVTDHKRLLAIDTKTQDSLDIEILEIAKHFDFFLPWAGMEKHQAHFEQEADVKAAEKMAKLYDEIKKDNPISTPDEVHNLNVFLSRLLFCFFAEDTDIFPVHKQFTNGIQSHTQPDGSDLHTYLDNLFIVLNTEERQRQNLPSYLEAFPYVNGGLFRGLHSVPVFTSKSRKALIDNGILDWSKINPDIFGSMIQAVVTPEHRGGMGMHYTSVPNIMKVVEPLFLNELYEEFENSKNEPRKLQFLLQRIASIKIFDPACGSGNFLIISYKELRLLEIKILQQLQTLQKAATGFEPQQLVLIPKAQLTLAAQYQPSLFSVIELSNFYGIELDDFAHEIAILSLWLAQHQMNQKFKEVFGSANPTLPLQAGGNIIQGNATRLDWESICPKNEGDEIYILGNPPYLGSKNLSDGQRADMEYVFKKDGKLLDYISAWYYLGSKYSYNINSKFAFVTTNSICQGEQVALLWPKVLGENLEIFFAHQSFKWENNAKNKAAVTVVIVGVRNKNSSSKIIYNNKLSHKVLNINPYLFSGPTIYVHSRNIPFNEFPEMIGGNVAYDSGHLILEENEVEEFIRLEPNSKKYIKKLIGGQELLNGGIRYCLWFKNISVEDIVHLPYVLERIELVKRARLKAKDEGTHRLAERSHQFRDLNNPENYIAIPKTSSERRQYIPMLYLNGEYIPADSIRIIPNGEAYLFGILSSKIHMAWVKTISGRLKTDYRYSKNLSYNTFPFPTIDDSKKHELEKHTYRILDEREKYSEKTLAQLYDPDKMPQGLREAHHQLDLAVEQCYRSKPFETDEERLEYLFKLYEQMIAEENSKGTLFEVEAKPKKKPKKK